MDKWWQRGWDNLDDFKIDYSKMPRRLWLPEGSSKIIIFLDGEPFRFYEHQLYLNSSWMNWFSCRRQGKTSEVCPLCDFGDSPYYVGMYTVIDCSEWTDRKGVVHKNERKIFAAKIDTMKLLKLKKEKLGGLALCKFEVSRIGAKSPSVGNNFEFIERVDEKTVEKMLNEGREGERLKVEPFNYEEIFAPLPKERLEAIVRKINNERAGAKPEYSDEDQPPY